MSSLHDGFSTSSFDPVAEPFRGFRAFLIDDLDRLRPQPFNVPRGPVTNFHTGGPAGGGTLRGSLRGIFMSDYVWGPGVNKAVCMGRGPWLGSNHDTAIEVDCDCGFWAYTNGDHYLSVSGPAALGIVEAWGRMIIGPHGFRAEKARIVALTFPRPAVTAGDEVWVQVPPAAPVKRSRASLFSWLKAWADLLASNPQGSPVPTPPTSLARAAHPWELVTDELREAVRRLYPHVPVYDSVTAMQEAHPLTDTTRLLDEATHQPKPEVEGQ